MVEFFILSTLVVAALSVAAIVGFVFFLLKLTLWAVILPFRLLLKVLMIPVWLTLGALGVAAGAVALPLLLVAIGGLVLVGIVGVLLAVLLPLVPFVLLGLMIWAVFRRRGVAA